MATSVNFKNVLFATDFSACAEAAFSHALAIAQRYRGKIFVLHVITPDTWGYAPPESASAVLEQIRRRAREQVADFERRINFRGVAHQSLFGEGEVWDTIEAIIAEHKIDLIVLGTRGRRGLKKLILGSVAEEIVRLATRPVLTAGPQCKQPAEDGFRRILYPTDFSEQALKARDFALALARQFHAAIIAMHVIPVLLPPRDLSLDESRLLPQLEEVMAVDAARGLEVELHIHHGDPAAEILRAASEYKADLIVMSVHGAGATPRLSTALGSTVHYVVSHAQFPVLTVRA
jgi:nucleotide-binding universal stress UspA family protein